MLRPRLGLAFVLAFVSASGVFACAEGEKIEDGDGGGSDGLGGNGGTGGQTTDTSVGASSNDTTNNNGAGPPEGGAPEGGAPPETGGGGMGEGGSPPVGCDFTAPEMCTVAEPLPAVAGDKNADMVTRTGDTNKFFKIHIEEQDSGILDPEDLSYTVSLTSPPGAQYNLIVRESSQAASVPNCNGTPKNGTGAPQSVHASWGDDQGFGGEDDSVWLIIEIQHVSGEACGPDNSWTLLVRGNT